MIKTIHIFALLLVSTWGVTATAEVVAEVGTGSGTAKATAIASPPINAQLPDFSSLVQRQGPTVVNVRVFRSKAEAPAMPGTEPDKRQTQPPRESGLGSGFVVTSNGLILTNRHVVANAEKIRVRFSDKRELPAIVIGVDPLTDLAVLKVDAQNLPTATQGDSSKLKVGQWVLAIGAPMGLERTATQGIISALGRELPNDNYVSFIQTDVPINPGNSGGPLFDQEGRVIGINSQIVSTSGGYMGLSFAIPINVAVTVAKQILEHGHATHGWLGASAQELTVELAQAYGLEAARGALITEITPAGPAQKAGLQPGDIILALDNSSISESADLPPAVGACLPGSEHVLSVLRDGQIIPLKVKMGELGQAGAPKTPAASLLTIDRFGVKVSDLDAATQQVLAIRGGVRLEAIEDGPATTAGLQVGDMLLKLGRFTLDNAKHLQSLVASLPAGQTLPLLVKREDNVMFLTITLARPK